MSVRRRHGNSWEINVNLGYDPASGKRLRLFTTVHGSRRDAEAEERRLLRERDTGSVADPHRLTVADYLAKWLQDYARPNVALKTLERYEDIVNRHLVPALGSLPLAKLKPLHIQDYYGKALQSGRLDGRGGLSPKTVLHHHRVLHLALKQAVRWQLLNRNPCDAVLAPRPLPREMHALDEVQTLTLLDGAVGTELHAPLVIAASTGLRRGELLALRWQDVDLAAATLAVRQSVVESRAGDLSFKLPKTPKSRRVVALPQMAVRILMEHHRSQLETKLAIGSAYADHNLVFPRLDGRPWSPDAFSCAFRALTRRLQLPIRLHDLRHTHATQLLRQGIHPKIVSERLGHATVAITLDTYSHVLDGMDREAADSVDRALSAARKPLETPILPAQVGKMSARTLSLPAVVAYEIAKGPAKPSLS